MQVTFVDGSTFIAEYADRRPAAARPDLGGDGATFRPVVDLLVEQARAFVVPLPLTCKRS